jgi:hypothetical protein
MTDLGSRFVAALAAKDTNRLVALFASEVDFRGMTPRRFWEVDTPQIRYMRVICSGIGRLLSEARRDRLRISPQGRGLRWGFVRVDTQSRR